MNDIKLLEVLFGDKLIKSESGKYGRPCIKLEEDTKGNSYSITIAQVPENATAIKTDSFPNLQDFFNCSSETGQCKCADFAIITDDKLIFIELSTANKLEKKVVRQLKGAQCVLEYCQSIGDKFYNNDSFLEGRHSYFVSIAKIGANKKGKRTPAKNNTPDEFRKISSPHNLQFQDLCCKK